MISAHLGIISEAELIITYREDGMNNHISLITTEFSVRGRGVRAKVNVPICRDIKRELESMCWVVCNRVSEMSFLLDRSNLIAITWLNTCNYHRKIASLPLSCCRYRYFSF